MKVIGGIRYGKSAFVFGHCLDIQVFDTETRKFEHVHSGSIDYARETPENLARILEDLAAKLRALK